MQYYTKSRQMKPIKRSGIRIRLGKTIFTLLRHVNWIFGKDNFALKKNAQRFLPTNIFTHSTPLIRDLNGLDIILQHNKIINLLISIEKINGLIMKPGETFSFWRLVGKPTKRKGYLDGLVLNSGVLTQGVGGGLCQLTNLIYWISLHTPLQIIQRYRHSYDVFPDSNRTQPFGSGATCVYNYRDLMIKNNTNQSFQLKLHMDEEALFGCWKSDEDIKIKYEVYEKKHWITSEYWGGYVRHNEIRRKARDTADNLILDEFVAENHALMMYQPFICEKVR